jgi:mono/diheme cytochrome c family protein
MRDHHAQKESKMKIIIAGIFGLLLAHSTFAARPNFNQDIAPIVYENCAGCHRPGAVAPFPLLTYHDVAKRARLIVTVTRKRYMPPWKAEPQEQGFQDTRRLTQAQIEMIAEWAEKGAPEGDAKDKPVPPQFATGWQAGKPDLVLSMQQPFTVPADGPDIFQCFVVPLHFDQDQYVKTVEFHSGNPRVVHHALFFLDSSGEAQKLDAATPEPGYSCFGGPKILPSGLLGGWAPGATPRALPTGMAQSVQKGSTLVIQVHYHPSGKPESDQSSLGLTFGESPTKGVTRIIAGTRQIDIPAGDAHYEAADSMSVPEDVDLIGIAPHAHLLCKEMKVNAQLPDGKTEQLIWIRDWDFNWQGEYRYAKPVHLPKGTRIEMRYLYDNSVQNPHNPSDPPKRVTYGEQTTDEMGLVFLQVVLPHPEDVAAFRREFFLERIDQFLAGRLPADITPQTSVRLRTLIPRFDANQNGTLEPDERLAMLQFLKGRMR